MQIVFVLCVLTAEWSVAWALDKVHDCQQALHRQAVCMRPMQEERVAAGKLMSDELLIPSM